MNLSAPEAKATNVNGSMATPYFFFSLPKVLARFAIFATLGFVDLAAFASFLAGIFFPSGTWSASCKAPLCLGLIAFCIHLVAIWGLSWLLDLWCSFFLNFLDQLEYFLERSSSQVRHDVVHELCRESDLFHLSYLCNC